MSIMIMFETTLELPSRAYFEHQSQGINVMNAFAFDIFIYWKNINVGLIYFAGRKINIV